MSRARVTRGRQTEEALAAYLRDHGWPHAERRAASLPGSDVLGLPGVDVEVKATADVPLLAALRQVEARRVTGSLPLVVWRPNGYGPSRIDEWVVALQLRDAVGLLVDAGYGDPA